MILNKDIRVNLAPLYQLYGLAKIKPSRKIAEENWSLRI